MIPTGTEARGRISEIAGVSKKNRTAAAMNADFSRARRVRITFDELQLPDGRQVAIHADALPGSSGVVQCLRSCQEAVENRGRSRYCFSPHPRSQAATAPGVGIGEGPAPPTREDPPFGASRIAQLPYRPQYPEAGTIFNASLQQPLNFGQRVLPADSHIRTTPPAGSLVRAARNGLLRIQFQKIVPPDGVGQTITASLDAVEVSQKEHLTLDSEGGAQATAPKTRYFSTGLSVVVAASSMSSDNDRDGALHGGGDGGKRAVTGISGFRLVGMFAGALGRFRVRSRGLGFYRAGRSLYSHFLARGHEVVYPKEMSMLVGVGKNPHGGSSSTRDSQPN